MVSYKEIQASNALINDATAPRVAVFVGGTSGIGKFTVRALVATGASVRIYLVGRKSSEERVHAFIQELHAINPKTEVVWTEGEVALLAETKRLCEVIKSKESRVDLLFLTAGYAPFGARRETAEGLEIAQSLEYYSRMLFVLHLLPLLGEAKAPKVVSVLAGGLERATIDVDDLDLKKPGNFSFMKAQTQYAAMNTTTLEKLANDNPNVTFIHSWPGWVNTGNVRRGLDPNSIIMAWFVWLILEPLIRLFAFSDEESGQRYLFQSTSASFGGRGVLWNGKPGINSLEKPADGLFLVNYKCECTPNAKVMPLLREKALLKRHTTTVRTPSLVVKVCSKLAQTALFPASRSLSDSKPSATVSVAAISTEYKLNIDVRSIPFRHEKDFTRTYTFCSSTGDMLFWKADGALTGDFELVDKKDTVVARFYNKLLSTTEVRSFEAIWDVSEVEHREIGLAMLAMVHSSTLALMVLAGGRQRLRTHTISGNWVAVPFPEAK